jgi:hypothetical protein
MQGLGGNSREPEDVSLGIAAEVKCIAANLQCGGKGCFVGELFGCAFVGYTREKVGLPCNFKPEFNILFSSSSELGTEVARQQGGKSPGIPNTVLENILSATVIASSLQRFVAKIQDHCRGAVIFGSAEDTRGG